MRKINAIVIHCSATPEGQNFTVEDIRKWHLARNFVDVGYHFVITLDGNVQVGRPLDQIGAHCPQKEMNHVSVGICYIGGYAADGNTVKDTRTPAQKLALKSLVKRLSKRFSIPEDRIFGHRDFANKACPCFDVHAESWT